MAKFRKKPVVIEAFQVPMNDSEAQMIAWGSLAAWLQMGGCDFEVAARLRAFVERLSNVNPIGDLSLTYWSHEAKAALTAPPRTE